MPDSSAAAAAKPALDAPQGAFDQGVSGIVSMLMIFIAVQVVAMIAGKFLGQKLYPDSRDKRQIVFGVARLVGVVAGAFLIYLWARSRSST
jgi:multisubunit Na+/H+ antiporter MnhB subunit